MTKELEVPSRTYTVNDLRAVLSEAIDDLRHERSSPANVNAIANAAGKILHTLRLQMEYQQMTGIRQGIPMLEGD